MWNLFVLFCFFFQVKKRTDNWLRTKSKVCKSTSFQIYLWRFFSIFLFFSPIRLNILVFFLLLVAFWDIHVVSVQGTNPWNFFDLVQDAVLFNQVFLIQFASHFLPSIRYLGDDYISWLVKVGEAVQSNWGGFSKSHFYHHHVEVKIWMLLFFDFQMDKLLHEQIIGVRSVPRPNDGRRARYIKHSDEQKNHFWLMHSYKRNTHKSCYFAFANSAKFFDKNFSTRMAE